MPLRRASAVAQVVRPAKASSARQGFASRPDASFRDKRFYESAAAARLSDADGGGYTVALDGRALKTPGKKISSVPTKSLAMALATEWDDQQDVVRTDAMPLYTLACSAIDLDEARAASIKEELGRYLATDTVCFQVSEGESFKSESLGELRARQQAAWTPLIEWMADTFGGRMSVAGDLSPRVPPHDDALIASVEGRIADMSRWEIAAMESMANGAKSLVVPLALHARRITAEAAVEASRVEMVHQIAEGGRGGGSHDVDRANLRAQITAASIMLWTTTAA